jgi:peptidoglycan hydrolase-like protein with peptidoglycan-binding domain
MFLGILTLITALTISAVAIYYSVAGLMTIFAAAALPIMIMGGALEIGKLVTAVWLHRYWKQATWWLKSYLTVAVLVLMFITSMGIFGFLSKAHIEQTATAQEGVAQIERIETEISRQEAVIARAEQRIEEARNSDNNRDVELQEQIAQELERVDSAYARVQPAIDEQLATIEAERIRTEQRVAPVQSEVDSITTILNDLQTAINTGDIEKAQGIVGTAVDGDYGPNTARAVEEFRAAQLSRRDTLVAQIDRIKTEPNSTVDQARNEIQRLRNLAEQQIADSNTLIERLRSQLGQGDAADVETLVDEQTARITQANNTIDTLTEERYALEADYRKLEAEVGPVKYIAEFIYGERADTNLLEEAVRWVILIIIFVFDPLAVLLLIASQYTFEIHRKRKDDQKELLRLKEWNEYERKRAQRIVDNPGYNPNPSTNSPSQEEKVNESDRPNDEQSDRTSERGTERGTETTNNADNTDTVMHRLPGTGHEGRDDPAGMEGTVTDNSVETQFNELTPSEAATAYSGIDSKKKDIELQEEFEEDDDILEERKVEWDLKENDLNLSEAKTQWKAMHPDETIKMYKILYLKGKIDTLPWESLLNDTKDEQGYIQNSEQNESTLFNRLRRESKD